MRIIGITGGSGSGKTSVLRMLEKRGLYAVDADAVYHGLLERNADLARELSGRFPGVEKDGKIDRAKLARIVFSDPLELHALNSIAHVHVLKELRRMLREAAAQGVKAAAVDAAALFESGFDRECDCTVGVIAPRGLRIKRIAERDGLSEADARKRVDAQKNDDFYRGRCTFVLENAGNLEALEAMIPEILEKIK